MKDAIEGRCKCDFCTYHADAGGWRFLHLIQRKREGAHVLNFCPCCHYRLDPDGYARRMVNATVEELRAMIREIENSRMAEGFPDFAEAHVHELKRLLPEHETIAEIMHGSYEFSDEQMRRMQEGDDE